MRAPMTPPLTGALASGSTARNASGVYETRDEDSESDEYMLAIEDAPKMAKPVDEYTDPFAAGIEVIRQAGLEEQVYTLYHKIKNKGNAKDKKAGFPIRLTN